MNRTHVGVAAATALLTAGVTAAVYSPASADQSAKADPPAAAAQPGSAGKATGVTCNGKALVGMKSKASDTAHTFVETATNNELHTVPGTTITMNGPASGTDTVLITFTAEALLGGGDGIADWMTVVIQKGSSPILPTNTGDAFTSDSPWSSHSVQACVKIGPGSHTFSVAAGLFDATFLAPSNTLNGSLDNYIVSALRFN